MGTKRRLERDQAFKHWKPAKTAQRRRRLETGREIAGQSEDRACNDLLPDLRLRQVALTELRPSSHRARRSTADHVRRLMASISDPGFTVLIFVREAEIVDGHVRVEAAWHLGMEYVPAIEVVHLSPRGIHKLNLVLNRTTEPEEWDLDRSRIEIADLIDLEMDLSSTGCSAGDPDIILLGDPGKGNGGIEAVLAETDETFARVRKIREEAQEDSHG